MATFIYKPNTYKGPVILIPGNQQGKPVTITTKDGRVIEGKFLNYNEGRSQYVFPRDIYQENDMSVSFDGQEGTIPKGVKALEGNSLSDWTYRANGKGDIGNSAVGGNMPSGFAPGSIGYGSYPAYLGDIFPEAKTTEYTPIDYKGSEYKPIETAPYNFTDPQAFAQNYGEFNRGEIQKNYGQSKELALDTLNTELQSLQAYVPATAALKRSEVSIDNQFNQAQRDRQVEATLPGARASLEAQAGRMETYAKGNVPDAVQDAALNRNARSTAADVGAASGFGAGSGQSQKTSDLMTAEQRLQIAQYGEQGIGSNISQRNQLLAAPLQQSNAGAQVNVMPSLSASQLTQSNLNEINQNTLINPTNALQSTTQQNQFTTGLEQQTRQYNATNTLQNDQFNVGNVFAKDRFNASNTLQNDQFNATNLNNFALKKFDYNVDYAGAVAGASQTNTNTQVSFEQQARAEALTREFMKMAQAAGTTQSLFSGLTSILGSISSIFSGISDLLGGKPGTTSGTKVDNGGTTRTPEVTPPVNDTVSPDLNDYETSPNPGFTEDELTTPDANTDTGNEYVPDETSYPDPNTPEESDTYVQNTLKNIKDSGRTVTKTSDGGYKISPLIYDNSTVKNYAAVSGDDVKKYSPATVRSALNSGKTVLASAGITDKPVVGTVSKGYGTDGKPVYANKAIDSSQDPTEGKQQMDFLKRALDPLGAFSREDASIWDKAAVATSDASTLLALTDAARNRDYKGFSDLLIKKFGVAASEQMTDNKNSQVGIQAGMDSYLLFSNWDNMSAAAKGRSLASIAIKGYQSITGDNLAKTPIITNTDGTTALNVGGALELLGAGINVYSLATNWNDLDTIHKVIYGTGSAANVAYLADKYGLLGNGVSGSAMTPTAAAQVDSLVSAGKAVNVSGSGLGVETYQFASQADVPTGMVVQETMPNGQVIAAPQSTIGSYATGTLGATGVVAGVYQVASGWGSGGEKGALNGAMGGGAIVGGLAAMQNAGWLGAAGPYGWAAGAAIVATSVIGNMVYTGKNKEQIARDGVRDVYAEQGLTDKDANVTLADGSKFNIGVDGKGNTHTFTNLDKRANDQKDRTTLYAYDVDYTNDLDYAFSTAGITLSRLATGAKATNVDQMGGHLTNAALSTVGYGKELSKENFNKVNANMRAMYSQAGIKDKATAYALANKAYSEGRISATDHYTAQRSADMIYDKDGYDKAKAFSSEGRFKGIEAAQEQEKKDKAKADEIKAKAEGDKKSKAAAILNKKFGTNFSTESSADSSDTASQKEEGKDTVVYKPAPIENSKSKGRPGLIRDSLTNPDRKIKPAARYTKEELRALNERRYSEYEPRA